MEQNAVRVFFNLKRTYRRSCTFIAFFLFFIWKSVWSSTCSSTVSNVFSIQREQNGFTEAKSVKAFMGTVGLVSNSSYYMYWLNSTSNISAAILKTAVDGSNSWVTSLVVNPLRKSLAVDSSESFVYFCENPSYIQIIKLAASTGRIASVTTL